MYSNRFQFKPSAWETAGTSYVYNTVPFSELETRLPADDVTLGTAKLSWVRNPSKFILMHEPAARRWGQCFYQWHGASRNEADVFYGNPQKGSFIPYNTDSQRFISPLLYVDGHVEMQDSSRHISEDPIFCLEETAEWQWYQPMPAAKLGSAQ